MKLGTQTGSLTNHVLSRAVIGQPHPVVGMAATILSWTDRHPATVVHVYANAQVIEVQEDRSFRTDSNGMSESQTYRYMRDPVGSKYHFRRDKNGCWHEVIATSRGRWKKTGGMGLRIGEREEYRDFSF
jgi:hypothetical protein